MNYKKYYEKHKQTVKYAALAVILLLQVAFMFRERISHREKIHLSRFRNHQLIMAFLRKISQKIFMCMYVGMF